MFEAKYSSPRKIDKNFDRLMPQITAFFVVRVAILLVGCIFLNWGITRLVWLNSFSKIFTNPNSYVIYYSTDEIQSELRQFRWPTIPQEIREEFINEFGNPESYGYDSFFGGEVYLMDWAKFLNNDLNWPAFRSQNSHEAHQLYEFRIGVPFTVQTMKILQLTDETGATTVVWPSQILSSHYEITTNWFGFIINPLCFALPNIFFTAFMTRRKRRRRRSKRIASGLCIHCGYDVKDLPICPECGFPITQPKEHTQPCPQT